MEIKNPSKNPSNNIGQGALESCECATKKTKTICVKTIRKCGKKKYIIEFKKPCPKRKLSQQTFNDILSTIDEEITLKKSTTVSDDLDNESSEKDSEDEAIDENLSSDNDTINDGNYTNAETEEVMQGNDSLMGVNGKENGIKPICVNTINNFGGRGKKYVIQLRRPCHGRNRTYERSNALVPVDVGTVTKHNISEKKYVIDFRRKIKTNKTNSVNQETTTEKNIRTDTGRHCLCKRSIESKSNLLRNKKSVEKELPPENLYSVNKVRCKCHEHTLRDSEISGRNFVLKFETPTPKVTNQLTGSRNFSVYQQTLTDENISGSSGEEDFPEENCTCRGGEPKSVCVRTIKKLGATGRKYVIQFRGPCPKSKNMLETAEDGTIPYSINRGTSIETDSTEKTNTSSEQIIPIKPRELGVSPSTNDICGKRKCLRKKLTPRGPYICEKETCSTYKEYRYGIKSEGESCPCSEEKPMIWHRNTTPDISGDWKTNLRKYVKGMSEQVSDFFEDKVFNGVMIDVGTFFAKKFGEYNKQNIILELDVNWGSSTQAQTYKSALTTTLRLNNIGDHVKNYVPQILVLCGRPLQRPPLVDFAHLITKQNSLLVIGDIVNECLTHRIRSDRNRKAYKFLNSNKIKAFYCLVDNMTFEIGARALLQTAGIGKLSPNVLMMGYKNDWQTCSKQELCSYFNVLHAAFDYRLAVSILRLPEGIDYSKITEEIDQTNSNGELTVKPLTELRTSTSSNMMRTDSNLSLPAILDNSELADAKNGKSKNKKSRNTNKDVSLSLEQEMAIENMNIFKGKQRKGYVDVWWLYDDGGLTMLLPYIISNRAQWSGCKLRVFALAMHKKELELEERNMAHLLTKFRLDYSSLKMVSLYDKPQDSTISFFNQLLSKFKTHSKGHDKDCEISESEISALQDKTYRQLRLRELLLEHSSNANLVVMSLPMPRKGTVSAPLYMAWLEVLTKDMPPYLLVRGNQQSVLTFYS